MVVSALLHADFGTGLRLGRMGGIGAGAEGGAVASEQGGSILRSFLGVSLAFLNLYFVFASPSSTSASSSEGGRLRFVEAVVRAVEEGVGVERVAGMAGERDGS